MGHQTADQPGRNGAVPRLGGTAEGPPAGPAAGRFAEGFFGFCRRVGGTRAYNALSGPLLAAVFFWLLILEFHHLSRVFRLPESYAYDAAFHAWLVATISKIVFLSLLVALLLFRRQPVNKARGLLPRITAIAGTFMVMLVVLIPAPEPVLAQSIAGLVLICTGSILSVVSVSFLGRSFSIMAEARELVTTGVYSLVRHPLYVAEEIAVLGAIVINFSPLAVLLLAVHIACQIQRARNEEGVLSEAFPEYEAYKLRTRRFIPGVY
ncbi:MAG: isoprenylcysteine carboxylmethyltransferase family protein [Rhodospirillales bacterium]|nr:isoprenylcysteine carboxylmethyltransferase family protein [Rhodospirillales bacterium]